MYFNAKSPSRGFWILMYRPLEPRSLSPSSNISSSNKFDVRPIPENLGKLAMAMEHFGETTSISPPFVMMSAAAGWQTNEDGFKGS